MEGIGRKSALMKCFGAVKSGHGIDPSQKQPYTSPYKC